MDGGVEYFRSPTTPNIGPAEKTKTSSSEVASLPADPRKAVPVVDQHGIPEPVQVSIQSIREVDLTPKEVLKLNKINQKKMTADLKGIERHVFKGFGSIDKRMGDVDTLADKANQIQIKKNTIKKQKYETASKLGKLKIKIQNRMSVFISRNRVGGLDSTSRDASSNVAFTNVILDTYAIIDSAKKGKKALVDDRRCNNLIQLGKKELSVIAQMRKDPGISDLEMIKLERRESVISRGITQLEERIQLNNAPEHVQKGAIATVQVAHSGLMVAGAGCRLAHVVAPAVTAVPVAGQVIGLVALPITAGLAIDSLVAVKRNHKQARDDLKFVDHRLQGQVEAGAQMAEFRALRDIPGVKGTSIETSLSQLNVRVRQAHDELDRLDKRLIQGDFPEGGIKLTKADIKLIRKQKAEARAEITKSMSLAIELFEDSPGVPMPGLERAYRQAKAQQVMTSSALTLDYQVSSYFSQKLKKKQTGEVIRGTGDALHLAGAAVTGVGLVSGVASGGYLLPIALVGLGISISAVGTTYGVGWAARKIKNLQLGKDRVSTKQFDAAVFSQMKNEMAVWDSIPAGQHGNTTTAALYEIIKKHDPAISGSAREWASALVNEPENGPRHVAFNEARARMIDHDTTKGIIGSLIKKAFAAFQKRVFK